MQIRDITIVGAGPAGLAAAIAAKQAGLDYSILEKGVLVNSIYGFPVNMVFFTTPELLEIGGLPLVSPFEKPTRLEALRYYRRVVDTYDLAIEFEEQVVGVRAGRQTGPARRPGSSPSRRVRRRRAPHSPQPQRDLRDRLFRSSELHRRARRGSAARVPLLHRAHGFYRKNVVIVGGGNSAAETALELFRSGVHVTLVHRHSAVEAEHQILGAPGHREPDQGRIGQGTLQYPGGRDPAGARDRRNGTGQRRHSSGCRVPAHRLPPDCDLYRRAGIRLQKETMSPEFNPETFETNVPGIFLAGGAICGRDTSNIFIENGRFHGEAIIKTLAARRASRGAVAR